MVVNMYSIHDKLADTWSNPFCLMEKVAQRNFEYMAKEMADADKKDREVVHVGLMETDDGTINGVAHNTVYTFRVEG